MHQVLTLEEILAQIFGSLQKHELFNCVLVCQAFKEPGLDLLWEELDGYVPWANPDSNVRAQRAAEGLRSIFNCLPSDLITAEDGNPMKLIRPPRDDDWDRFNSYARRIKILGHGQTDGAIPPFSDNFFIPILAYLRQPFTAPVCLFPNLTTLRWDSSNVKYEGGLPCFLAPSLRKIVLGHQQGRAVPLEDVMELNKLVVLGRLPLTDFALLNPTIDPHSMTTPLSTFINACLTLKRIDIPLITFQESTTIQEALQKHPSMSVLRLKSDSLTYRRLVTPVESVVPCEGQPAYSYLRSLYATFLAESLSVLRRSASKMVESLTVVTQRGWYPEQLAELARLVGTKAPLLRWLSINEMGLGPDGQGRNIRWMDILRPLESCHRLVSLQVSWQKTASDACFTLNDDALEELVSSWPALEILELDNIYELDYRDDGAPERVPRLTLRSLVTLSVQCSLLIRLIISIDASVATDIITSPTTLVKLEELDLRSSWITPATAEKVLPFLLELIPPSGCSLVPQFVSEDPNDSDRICAETWNGVTTGIEQVREQSQPVYSWRRGSWTVSL